ncbi:MAG: hypothetical protein RMI56_01405 [Sulfolobales archaeon]|nr:hypothetical protein [Sulfolobales archaeon]MDW8082436.1 hypothetical protein [Sulfolobales archaeon]
MSNHAESFRPGTLAGIKKESRIALVKKIYKLNLIVVFVLRGVKGLEKAYVIDGEEELNRILGQFSAVILDVDTLDHEKLLNLPNRFREVITHYGELLKRLSSELTPLIG